MPWVPEATTPGRFHCFMTIVYLNTRSWKGISLGAIHTYGELHWEGLDEKVTLSRPMTQKEKAEYNKCNAEQGFPQLKARRDQRTHGFSNELEVISAAIKECDR